LLSLLSLCGTKLTLLPLMLNQHNHVRQLPITHQSGWPHRLPLSSAFVFLVFSSFTFQHRSHYRMQSHFTCAHPDLHICPIQSCQWYTSTNDPDEVKLIVRTHLVQIHDETSHSMNAISDDTFASYDLHPCRTCNSP
jgi:predicted small metal-binding protein